MHFQWQPGRGEAPSLSPCPSLGLRSRRGRRGTPSQRGCRGHGGGPGSSLSLAGTETATGTAAATSLLAGCQGRSRKVPDLVRVTGRSPLPTQSCQPTGTLAVNVGGACGAPGRRGTCTPRLGKVPSQVEGALPAERPTLGLHPASESTWHRGPGPVVRRVGLDCVKRRAFQK